MALAGCGFSPVFGTGGTASVMRGAIDYDTPATTAGFAMRQRLEDQLGLTQTARFQLRTTLTQTTEAAAVTPSGDTTRFHLRGTSGWELATLDGTVLGAGDVQSFTSYSSTGSTVATQAATDDARDRLSVALADLIVAQVLVLQVGPAQ